MSAQVTLGVGFAAVYFSACCPPMLFIGTTLVGAGLALFTAWRWVCKTSACTMTGEIAITLSGTVLPLLMWMKVVFPALAVCENPLATAVLTSVVAAVAAAAITCKEQS